MDRIEHFNAMETDYTWDAANRLTGIAHNGPTNLVSYSFMLDANGNRTQETISPGPVMPAILPSDDTSFAYNTPRNRLNATSKPTYAYNDEGQLTGNVNTVANQYTYDDEGQLTGKGTKAYTFDDAHRLIQRGTDTFTYDGVGNRIKATRGSAQVHYIYDAAGNLLAQANATTGGIQRYYIYGAGLVATQFGANYYVYHFDGTGHTVGITDKDNAVTHKYAYAPYGKVLGQVEAFSQPFKYAGQVGIFTETDNLYYMRARYYYAETGRFISEDPAGFIDGPNLYAYVGGNPVGAVDPFGLTAQELGYISAAKRYMGGAGGSVTVDATMLKLIQTGTREGMVCCGQDYAVHGNVGLNSNGQILPGDFNFDQKPSGYYGGTWSAETKRLMRNGATGILEGATYVTGAAANYIDLNFSLNPTPFQINYSGNPNVIYDSTQ